MNNAKPWNTFAALTCMAWLGLVSATQAHDGVIEIRGQITSPSCDIGALQSTSGPWPTGVSGRDCGLSSSQSNPLSWSSVALVGEEILKAPVSTATSKKTVTLTYW